MKFPSIFHQFWPQFFICAGVLLLNGVKLQAQNRQKIVKIHINPNTVIGRISPNFIGFGYETSSVARPNFFIGNNTIMIQLYRNLSSHGLIRIGGNISDHTKYMLDGTSAPRTQKNTTVINKADLKNLGDFAQATGWKVMWGLNLATSSPKKVAQEATVVHKTLGNRLQSFEIGNEVDLLSQFSNYNDYYKAYLKYKKAIRKKLPNASFSGPDVAGNFNWFKKFAKDQVGDDIKLLTFHYYRGSSRDTTSTMNKLLKTDSHWQKQLAKMNRISQKEDVPYRINEVNSFSGGGKLGVSDAFGSALWSLDFMFSLASHGCSGINLETGINQFAWVSHYSPIARSTSGRYTIRPEYYGMLAFSMAGKGDLLELAMNKTDINLSAYATKPNQKFIWITIINKDLVNNAVVHVTLPEGYSSPEAFWLKAPSVKSKNHVTLAGTQVSANGTWKPGALEKIATNGTTAHLVVPHTSAVLLRLKQIAK
jgi:hypothetical protein